MALQSFEILAVTDGLPNGLFALPKLLPNARGFLAVEVAEMTETSNY